MVFLFTGPSLFFDENTLQHLTQALWGVSKDSFYTYNTEQITSFLQTILSQKSPDPDCFVSLYLECNEESNGDNISSDTSHNASDKTSAQTLESRIRGFLLTSHAFDQVDILFIGVHKDFRKKGVAKTLLTQLEKDCGDEAEIFLEVGQNNQAARNLYENLGYLPYNIRQNYYNNNEDALCLKKNLKKG